MNRSQSGAASSSRQPTIILARLRSPSWKAWPVSAEKKRLAFETSAMFRGMLNCFIVVSRAICGFRRTSSVALTCAWTISRVRSGSFSTKAREATKPRLVLPIGVS